MMDMLCNTFLLFDFYSLPKLSKQRFEIWTVRLAL